MYTIKQSTLSDLVPRAGDLFNQHSEEIPTTKHPKLPKPDMERYACVEAGGGLLILVVLDGEDALIGYSVNFVLNHPHYADFPIALNDSIFITKEHRRGRLGLQLIQATEKYAAKMGAQMMTWSAKPNSTLAKLMNHLGYGVHETTYNKEI